MNDPQALWAALWPDIGAVVAVASAIDAALPQPRAGSHWLVPRKLISLLAVNLANASNGAQPPLSSWLITILRGVLNANNLVAVPKADSGSPSPTP